MPDKNLEDVKDTLVRARKSLITITEHPDAIVAHLIGDIDVTLRERAGEALSRALDRALPLVLDLSRVRSIDSTGIAFLVQCCTIGRDEGFPVEVLEPSPEVSNILRLLGLKNNFEEDNRRTDPKLFSLVL